MNKGNLLGKVFPLKALIYESYCEATKEGIEYLSKDRGQKMSSILIQETYLRIYLWLGSFCWVCWLA